MDNNNDAAEDPDPRTPEVPSTSAGSEPAREREGEGEQRDRPSRAPKKESECRCLLDPTFFDCE